MLLEIYWINEIFLFLQGPELIHYSRFAKDGKEMKFMRYLYEDTRTLYDVFRRGARVSSISHSQIDSRVVC